MTDTNLYGLSETPWDDLSVAARLHFNKHYEAMCKYKDLMCHPKMQPIAKKHWHTVAFNSAYISACLVDGVDLPTVLPENDFTMQPLN